MSEEMARRKKEEEELLAKRELEMKEALRNDKCPVCFTQTGDFIYMAMLPPPMVWLECPNCGTVFCPESIRRKKIEQMGSPIVRA
jgi:hypothetical protein